MTDERRMEPRFWLQNDDSPEAAGGVPLDRVLELLREEAGDAQITVTRGARFRWQSPETDEEMEYRLEWKRRTDERHAEWERRKYAELKAKFEGNPDD